MRESARGHLYFELVEKGAGDEVLAKLDCVLWRTDHQRVAAPSPTPARRSPRG